MKYLLLVIKSAIFYSNATSDYKSECMITVKNLFTIPKQNNSNFVTIYKFLVVIAIFINKNDSKKVLWMLVFLDANIQFPLHFSLNWIDHFNFKPTNIIW